MISPTELAGVMIVELEPRPDRRGSFTRTFDGELFLAHGLDARIAQCSASFNPRAGTLRGLHYQAAPHEEAKLVHCTSGRVFDVVVDLRPSSPTHRCWLGVELAARGPRSLFIPPGCAHGFQTLVDDSELHYQMTVPYVGSAARGVRWDDPAFAIDWPAPPASGRLISERDRRLPDYVS
jgi:dTDP-4-dehydrorhamnose 3,5-epimerase